jgi:hypothetical protein
MCGRRNSSTYPRFTIYLPFASLFTNVTMHHSLQYEKYPRGRFLGIRLLDVPRFSGFLDLFRARTGGWQATPDSARGTGPGVSLVKIYGPTFKILVIRCACPVILAGEDVFSYHDFNTMPGCQHVFFGQLGSGKPTALMTCTPNTVILLAHSFTYSSSHARRQILSTWCMRNFACSRTARIRSWAISVA